MIRSMKQSDLDPVALIWLDTNIKAHDFIPASYWRDHFEADGGTTDFESVSDTVAAFLLGFAN